MKLVGNKLLSKNQLWERLLFGKIGCHLPQSIKWWKDTSMPQAQIRSTNTSSQSVCTSFLLLCSCWFLSDGRSFPSAHFQGELVTKIITVWDLGHKKPLSKNTCKTHHLPGVAEIKVNSLHIAPWRVYGSVISKHVGLCVYAALHLNVKQKEVVSTRSYTSLQCPKLNLALPTDMLR